MNEFVSSEDAAAGCPIGSDVLLLDDGTGRCQESMCTAPLSAIADEGACYKITQTCTTNSDGNQECSGRAPSWSQAPYDQAHVWWDRSFNNGTGVCMLGGMEGAELAGYKPSGQWGPGAHSNMTYQTQMCEGGPFPGSLYLGKRFEAGKFDTQAKCTADYCSLAGPEWANVIDETKCLSLGGQCDRWDCDGCETNWNAREAQGENRINHLCYIETTNETLCTAKAAANPDKGWTFDSTGFCWNSNSWRTECADVFAECEDLPSNACEEGATGAGAKQSALLLCRATGRSKCKDQASCEAVGECHGPMGGLRDEYCWSNGTTQEWVCQKMPFVCVKPQIMQQWHQSCDPYMQLTDTQQWDDRVHWYGHDKCIDLHNTTQSVCEANKGTWTSTFMNSTLCTADKTCVDRDGHERWQMAPAECTKCGGMLRSQSSWDTASWSSAKMVSSTEGDTKMVWGPRESTSVNKWTKVLYEDGLRDVVNMVKEMLRSASEGEFTSCMYGQQGAALVLVSESCGVSSDRRAGDNEDLVKPFMVARENIFAGNAELVGNSQKSNIMVAASTFASNTEVQLWEALFLPSGSSTVDTTTAASDSKATMYDASCYSVVTNTGGKIVGQLVGNCIQVKAAANFASSATLCLSPQDYIKRGSGFSVEDLAERTGTYSAGYSYKALSKVITSSTGQFCTDISANGWYCPIVRAASPESQTADQGSRSCGALDALVARVKLQQECSAGSSSACAAVAAAEPSVAATWGGVVIEGAQPTTQSIAPAGASSGGTSGGTGPSATKAPAPAPAPPPGVAPPPPSVVTQEITFSHITVDAWVGAVKVVYEVGYGITLGIYDTAATDYIQGCSVASSASAATRRAGVTVVYKATVVEALAQAAETKAIAVASNPATLASNVAAAKIAVVSTMSAEDQAAVNTMVVPTASDLVVKAPVVTQMPAASSSGSGVMIIVAGAAAGVVLLIGAVVIGYFFCFNKKKDQAVIAKTTEIECESTMTIGVAGVTPSKDAKDVN